MADNAAAFSGTVPEEYERCLGPLMFAGYAEDLARRVAALRPQRLLETAAGTGIVTRDILARLPAGTEVVATDLNPAMLEVARRLVPPHPGLVLQQADAQALPFPDAAFDVVACQFGVMFYPDKPRAHAEARRVLAPGGRYLFSVWDDFAHNPYAAVVHGLLRARIPADPPPFFATPYGHWQLDPIKEALLAAGFGDIRAHVLRIPQAVPDPARFARGLLFGTPVAEQLRARGGDAQALLPDLTAALAEAFGGTPGRTTLQAIILDAG